MSVRISSVSNISPRFGRSPSPIRDSFLTRMVGRSSPEAKSSYQTRVSPNPYHDLCQHMDTDASRKALLQLLTKQKSRAESEQVAEFCKKLIRETERNFGIVSAALRVEFRELVGSIAPELLIGFDEYCQAIESVTADDIKVVKRKQGKLLDALTLAFAASEEGAIWGNFDEWPINIAHNRIRNYEYGNTTPEAIQEIARLISCVNPPLNHGETRVIKFLSCLCESFPDKTSTAHSPKSVRKSSPVQVRKSSPLRKSDLTTKSFLQENNSVSFTTPEPKKGIRKVAASHNRSFSQDEIDESFDLNNSWISRSVVYHPKQNPRFRHRRPRKNMKSVNSKFAKLRQNARGETIEMPLIMKHVNSTSLRKFKRIVASSTPVKGRPPLAVIAKTEDEEIVSTLHFSEQLLDRSDFKKHCDAMGDKEVISRVIF